MNEKAAAEKKKQLEEKKKKEEEEYKKREARLKKKSQKVVNELHEIFNVLWAMVSLLCNGLSELIIELSDLKRKLRDLTISEWDILVLLNELVHLLIREVLIEGEVYRSNPEPRFTQAASRGVRRVRCVEACKGPIRAAESVGGGGPGVGDVGGADEGADSVDDVLALNDKDAHAAGRGDHAEEAGEEGLAIVLGIVEAGKSFGDHHVLETEDFAVGKLAESFHHGYAAVRSDDGVGLYKYKCAFHC